MSFASYLLAALGVFSRRITTKGDADVLAVRKHTGMTNARVKREAAKKRNQQRHKAAVRGAR